MDPDRWRRIADLFHRVLDMPPAERAAVVDDECVDDGAYAYLELTITTEDGPRVDDIGGDLTPEWGMHLVDANVVMGDLVNLVATQSAAWIDTR